MGAVLHASSEMAMDGNDKKEKMEVEMEVKPELRW